MNALRQLTPCFLALCTTAAHADLVAYDGFDNGPKSNLAGSTGGSGWTAPWVKVGDNVTKIAGEGLTYEGLLTSPGGAVTPNGGGVWPNSVYSRSFPAWPNGTTSMYVSFLLRQDTDFGMWGGLSFGSYPYEMTVGSPLGYYSFGLMLSEGLADITSVPLLQGETSLVVVKITKNAGPGVTYRLYVNPTVDEGEPAFADASMSPPSPNALPTTITIDNGTGFTTDEIRVGTSWTSVLPQPPVCTGDLNGDSIVNGSDVAMILGLWGLPDGDQNNDGTTDAADLAIVLGAWGTCP